MAQKKNIDWDAVKDLMTASTWELHRRLGVSRQAVYQARRKRGWTPSTGAPPPEAIDHVDLTGAVMRGLLRDMNLGAAILGWALNADRTAAEKWSKGVQPRGLSAVVLRHLLSLPLAARALAGLRVQEAFLARKSRLEALKELLR